MTTPIIYFDHEAADDAFKVLRALEERERLQPELANNRIWADLRQRARDRFAAAFKQ